MKYTGKLYGKITGRTFDIGKTAKNYDDLLNSLQEFVDVYKDLEYVINDEMRAILHRAESAIKKAT